MLGNSGDDLTNMWGLLALGATIVGIGFTLSAKAWRLTFWSVGGCFFLSGLLWSLIRRVAPVLQEIVTRITSNPSNWFLTFTIALAAIWLHQWRKELIVKARTPLPLGPNSPISTPELRRDLERQIVDLNNRLNVRLAALEHAKPAEVVTGQAVNWLPWRAMPDYSVRQFAKILSKSDPGLAAFTADGVGFRDLIVRSMKNGTLPYIREFGVSEWNGNRYEKPVDTDTRIEKSVAIAWAHQHRFPIEHVA